MYIPSSSRQHFNGPRRKQIIINLHNQIKKIRNWILDRKTDFLYKDGNNDTSIFIQHISIVAVLIGKLNNHKNHNYAKQNTHDLQESLSNKPHD